jgi:ubiquinone/menaquinone biosynthesis C-methylase UbiE
VTGLLSPAPSDHLLEIGCGQGVAVSLICPLLRTGTITAVDRSAAMIRHATDRNAAHVASGRATLHTGDFEAIDLPAAHYDKVFAVNVSSLWLAAQPGIFKRIRHVLAPAGELWVFAERPNPANASAVATRAAEVLAAHGFETTTHAATSQRGFALTALRAH